MIKLLARREFRLAMLLALLLPLQGIASTSNCAHGLTAPWAAAQGHCAPASGAASHHDGGSCCCVGAMAVAATPCVIPRTPHADALLLIAFPPPTVALDRLDRPPRPRLA